MTRINFRIGMMNQGIFKAYDVRGKYPNELNEKTAFKITAAVAKFFHSEVRSKNKEVRIVVGRDVRLSSSTLYKAVIRGVKCQGSNVKCIAAGVMTTPMLYFLVNKLKANGGIMVTASHNPKEYNGLKVVGKNARPMSGKDIEKLVISK